MIEHYKLFVNEKLALNDINLDNGFYLQRIQGNEEAIIENIVQQIKYSELTMEYDDRILAIITYLDKNDLKYSLMMRTFQELTKLSKSRLSHLFKSNLGISLKKYLIWVKLKSTIKQHISSKDDLFSALIDKGFYDQPHFNRNFKAMLGVKPAHIYNSRTLQVLPILDS